MCNENPVYHPESASDRPAENQDLRSAHLTVRESALFGLEDAPVEPKSGADYIAMT